MLQVIVESQRDTDNSREEKMICYFLFDQEAEADDVNDVCYR